MTKRAIQFNIPEHQDALPFEVFSWTEGGEKPMARQLVYNEQGELIMTQWNPEKNEYEVMGAAHWFSQIFRIPAKIPIEHITCAGRNPQAYLGPENLTLIERGAKDEETQIVRCVVACRDSNGAGALYGVKVECTSDEHDEGLHYEAAIRAAEEEGYEVGPHAVVFDEDDWSFTAFNFDKTFNWDEADVFSTATRDFKKS